MDASERPALEGGRPIRSRPLPYGRHTVTADDVQAVSEVLLGDWLTTGPTVDEFERSLAGIIRAPEVVAVNSGTAALHAAISLLDLRPGDEVIVPALTFVASANAVLYEGGTPVFAEVDRRSFVLDDEDAEARITSRTRAIMLVHYAGLPVDLGPYRRIADAHGLRLIEDAAHALGAENADGPVGASSDLATFSFHPVKHITTGEGGAVATTSATDAAEIRRFRNHGLSVDTRSRERANTWATEMVALGFNYRLTDIGAALGISQLRRLPSILERRRALARRYLDAFSGIQGMSTQSVQVPDRHAWHIFPIVIDLTRVRVDRDHVIRALRAEGVGANLHYPPIHLHPYYRERFAGRPGQLPVTEDVCSRLVTLPLFASMSDADQDDVILAVRRVLAWYSV